MTKYRIVLTGAFKKDLKTAVKRGYDMDLLGRVVDTLAQGKPLPEKYRDHPLRGNYQGCRECHITPDWLLIYEVSNGELILFINPPHPSDSFSNAVSPKISCILLRAFALTASVIYICAKSRARPMAEASSLYPTTGVKSGIKSTGEMK